MPFQPVESWVAARKVSIDGSVFEPGDSVPGDVLASCRARHVLLSGRFVVPSNDPFGRYTVNATTRGPMALPVSVLAASAAPAKGVDKKPSEGASGASAGKRRKAAK